MELWGFYEHIDFIMTLVNLILVIFSCPLYIIGGGFVSVLKNSFFINMYKYFTVIKFGVIKRLFHFFTQKHTSILQEVPRQIRPTWVTQLLEPEDHCYGLLYQRDTS